MVRRVDEQRPDGDEGHRELGARLARLAGHPVISPERAAADSSYTSGGHAYYGVSVPERWQLVNAWWREHRDLTVAQLLATCDSLISSNIYEEKTLGCMIIKQHRHVCAAVTPTDIERWLGHLAGWAEVDSLCQNTIPASQMLADWTAWDGLIGRLAADRNINKRRAALVLLTGPVHYSADPRLLIAALRTVDALKHERAILITKAVSWMLRALTTQHRSELEAYLAANREALPAIAVRETQVKLDTGTKKRSDRQRRKPPDQAGLSGTPRIVSAWPPST